MLCALQLVVARAETDGWSQARVDSLAEVLEDEGVEWTEGNSVVFFTSGEEKFTDMFAAVRNARHSIHMEYFNFREDSIANALFDLLIEKVKEGVEVRLVFDAFGNLSNNQPLTNKKVKLLQEQGLQIYKFDPIRFPWVNHIIPRDHRKIVVIDGSCAYSGGMNVADYYITGTPEVGEWHDLHYRIEGDAVSEYQKIFLRMWERVTDEDVHGPQYYPGYRRFSETCGEVKPDTSRSAGRKKIGIANRETGTSPTVVRKTFVHLIDAAQTSIRIINPYFTLNGPIKRALKRAIKRGVNVQIMVSEASDIPITPRIVEYQVRSLMKKGAEVYFYQGGFHHSKIMLVDGVWAYVGSANLDSRSLRCDYECNALIVDSAATEQLTAKFESDKLTRCVPLTDAYWKEKSTWKRFQGWFYHLLLTPYVERTTSTEEVLPGSDPIQAHESES